MRRARERRRTVDRSIGAYTTLARERISAALRVPGRDWTLYGRETATRIDWKRDGPIRLEVLGAQEVVPPVMRAQQVSAGLRNFVPRLAFDPAAPTRSQWYALRLFAERQDSIHAVTDCSIPTLWDRNRAFRPNIVADQVDLFGGGVMLGGAFGRLALFGDAAWAGDRDALTTDGSLRSLGLGATFLNGIVRADPARALDGGRPWRPDLWVSLDGI